MLQRPNAVGLFVCEQVIIEERTRNITVVNSTARIHASQFPTHPRRFVVFGVLTDGLGDASMGLVISRLDNLEDIYENHWRMSFLDPLQNTRLILRFQGFTFPAAVRYQFSLLAGAECIAECVIEVAEETVK